MAFVVVLAVVVSYYLVVLVAVWVAWRNPRVAPRRTPAALSLPFDEVWIPTCNRRRLHGWWLAGGRGAPAVILVHGWGRNAERMLAYLPMLRPLGWHLLVIEARHHGLSDRDGFASLKKFSEDIRAAADSLVGRKEVDTRRLAVVGLSIGGSAAIHAAAHDPRLATVVTMGAFASPRDATAHLMRPHWLFAPALPLVFRCIEWRIGARLAELAPERHIGGVAGRVLLVHGEADRTVPVGHAHRLAHAADGHAELWVIPRRGHSDLHLEAGFPERLRAFLLQQLG
jgi:uncharacterized protein